MEQITILFLASLVSAVFAAVIFYGRMRKAKKDKNNKEVEIKRLETEVARLRTLVTQRDQEKHALNHKLSKEKEKRRLENRLGSTLTEDLPLDFLEFLNAVKMDVVLKKIMANWGNLSTIRNPYYDEELEDYENDSFGQMSPYDQFQAAAAMSSPTYSGSPDDFFQREPPPRYCSFPDIQWKKFIGSLTEENMEEKLRETSEPCHK